MEYKRRRKRTGRRRNKESGGGRALLLILILLGAVYLVSISAAGSWLSSHVVEPVVAMFTNKEENAGGTSAHSDEAQAVSAMTSGRIELPALECYLLQSGAFADEENANEQAKEIAALGGAGYVWHDGDRYRVIVCGYSTEQEAKEVKQSLSAQGMECSLHELHSAGAYEVAVTAGTDTTVSSLRTILFALLSAHDDLLELQKNFDAGQISVEDAARAAYEIYSELEECKSGSASVPKSISDMLSDVCMSVKELSQSDKLSEKDFSALLKKVQVEVACRFTETVNSLTEQ